jgi:NTP pyrophosphatase (non-canonical NTP hydrolase)
MEDEQIHSIAEAMAEVVEVMAKHTLTAYQQEIGEWSAKTFPKSTLPSTLTHLTHEVEELWQAELKDQPKAYVEEEAADVLILLIQFCNRAGIDLDSALRAKHAKNLQRRWLPPDAEGVVYHDPTT